jgi:hypothetical protein
MNCRMWKKHKKDGTNIPCMQMLSLWDKKWWKLKWPTDIFAHRYSKTQTL